MKIYEEYEGLLANANCEKVFRMRIEKFYFERMFGVFFLSAKLFNG